MTAQRQQQQPQEAGVTKTTLRLPTPLWTRLKHRAIDEGISIQELTVRALEAYLKQKAGHP